MQRIILDTNPSQRYEDTNGFLCIRHNPIAKAGVFEYLGKNLGMTGRNADKIVKVYRPFDELVKTAKEFEGMPITLDHHWVEGDHTNPTVMGIISGKVTAEEPYLYADIKIINDEARKAIESGEMRELSPGYTSQFEEENGEYNGEEYHFKQFDMHYNHLALVDVGRSGPDLKIVDAANTSIYRTEDNAALPPLFWEYIDTLEERNKLTADKTIIQAAIEGRLYKNINKIEAQRYVNHLSKLHNDISSINSIEKGPIVKSAETKIKKFVDELKQYYILNRNIVKDEKIKIQNNANVINKSINIDNKHGGLAMPKKLKIEDVDIDKLSRLLVDFFNEEKEEGVHNKDEDDVMVDIPSEDEDDVMVDIPTNNEDEDDVMVDIPTNNEDEDDVMVDIPTNNEDEDDVMVDIPSEDEDDIMIDIPSEDEDDVMIDIPSEDEDVAEIASKTVDAAIKSYKREHAKAMAAYDEVSSLVGTFKTYDSAGNMMSEKAIYKFACRRLGLDKVEGVSDYKSAFRAANFMQNKIGKSAPSEAKRFNDTAEDSELLTVDEIIKAAFRN